MLTNTNTTTPNLTDIGVDIDRLYDLYGVDVDEELANILLATITEENRNRKLKLRKLGNYMRDMDSGNFYRNGAAILLGEGGLLYDGMHRLEALRRVSRSRQAQGLEPLVLRFLIFGELSPEARLVIDNNAPRTFADANVIGSNVQYAKNVVPIGKRVYNWEIGQNPVPSGKNRLVPSEVEFKEFYLKHMNPLNQAAYWSGYLNQRIRIPSVSAGFGHYLIEQVTRAHHDETGVDVCALFFQQLATGAELVMGHPAKTLRETIARRRERRGDLDTEIGLALILRAWNAYAREELYRSAPLPEGKTVTNSNLALPVPPNANWTGNVYKVTQH